ncbi:hypothetical protein GCM10010145_45490 [Streptomyces ruber]|uniref:Purple acid phosphatase N-terminal domain-containing protein n=2 Tax=Streptomyces TaxID=1883 RepID=A0A918BIS5_9ACTN|nr:hypothetical protein GCM10010145_45490 [Streptomyces ruber]
MEQYHLHAALDRLRPGTTYCYGVGHEGFDPAGRPERLGSFRTAPARPEPCALTAFGDQGVGYDALAGDRAIPGQNPAFRLHAGDICCAGTSPATARRPTCTTRACGTGSSPGPSRPRGPCRGW